MPEPGRVLLIDDSDDYRELVSFCLRNAGYTVAIATDGKEGLELARREPFDLIITDLMLPNLNGYEICSLLKQDVRFQKIPLMVLTASKLLPQDEAMAKQCGADAFVPKLIDLHKLVERVQALLALGSSPKA